MKTYDLVIIGAGAAGLMCAATAGYLGRRVLVLDHANKAGKKILMSGGGRCNFTNLNSSARNFFSQNPNFCKSALARYRPEHFVELMDRHGLAYVEKAPGQLFCQDSAKDLLNILLTECEWAGVDIWLNTQIQRVALVGESVQLVTSAGLLQAGRVVVATGGLSIPTLGASGFGYALARQFGLSIVATRPALVPFTVTSHWKQRLHPLAGVSCDARVSVGGGSYQEPMLITHRGLSGPAMLQASSWWQAGDALNVNLLPEQDAEQLLIQVRQQKPKARVSHWLAEHLPKRLAGALAEWHQLSEATVSDLSSQQQRQLVSGLNQWQFKPSGTEGWRTAEVTMGGVDTTQISQQSFVVQAVPQLAFIGEVLDVTGELGGHNFQWAWASAVACGEAC